MTPRARLQNLGRVLRLGDPAITALIGGPIAHTAMAELVISQAPAADHAHLCNHAPATTEDTQGCPRWPACLAPGDGAS